MSKPTQVRQIRISVDTKGNRDIKALADQMGGMNRQLKSAAGSLSFFRNAFTGMIGAFGVRELVSISDSMQQLGARIRVMGGAGTDAMAIMEQLTAAASRSKTSVDGLATVYARLSAATKETGIRSSSLIALTETLQNTFTLSGSSISEATSAAIQLSQGLASGQLRGQELRSVLEANVVAGDLLAKSIGGPNGTRAELYKMAEAGKLTSGVVLKALFDGMDSVNSKSKQLSKTFEQSLTVAMNDVKLSIYKLNTEYNLSGKFATVLELATQKLGVILVGLALTTLPILIKGIYNLRTAFLALSASNIFLLGLTALATLMVTVTDDLEHLKRMFFAFGADVSDAVATVAEKMDKLRFAVALMIPNMARFILVSRGLRDVAEDSKAAADNFRKLIKDSEWRVKVDAARRSSMEAQAKWELAEDRKRIANMGKSVAKEKKVKEMLAELNAEYRTGKINAGQYYEKILSFDAAKLSKEFKDGKIDLEKYKLGLQGIEQVRVNRMLDQGVISLREFNNLADETALDQLNLKLQTGTINLKEYNKQFNELNSKFDTGNVMFVGAQSYLDSIGSTASQVSDMIKNTFSSLEDSLVAFVKNGTFSFKNFTQAVLDDLTRIIIRAAVIKPLADGILNYGLGSTAPTGGYTLPASNPGSGMLASKGAAFDGKGVRMFAKGGIVDRPVMFGYGGGKAGMMGEKGAEAILPLSRGRSGDLGVSASVTPITINVINNSSAEVQSRESTGANGERTIDLLIQNKVKEGFANGTYDKSMKTAYGLNRKGS